MNRQLSFDRSLYLPEAVEAAAAAYADYARIELATAGDQTVVTIGDVAEEDLDTVAHSFANHALYETIVRQRHAALEEHD